MTRLELEARTLRKAFPQFKFQDPHGPHGGVLGRLRANSGRIYVIWLLLRNFPNEAPGMYILEPSPLLAHDGRPLASIGASHAMHLLAPDAYGHPQVCHYNGQFWHPKVSLYKILLKARIWLEAYEEHLRSGAMIEKYLRHMG